MTVEENGIFTRMKTRRQVLCWIDRKPKISFFKKYDKYNNSQDPEEKNDIRLF